MHRARAGSSLIEVIAAVTILSVAGLVTADIAVESMRAVRQARDADAEMQAVSEFLDVVALWPREDLDRRLGERRQGTWLMYLERTRPALYTVVLTDTSSRVLLTTSLFRPEPRHADE